MAKFVVYPKLFSSNSEVGRELQNKIILFCLPTSEFEEKNTYQNDHLKWKSKFLCIQSLVLEEKGLKQGYIFKLDPFISVMSYLTHFKAGLNYPPPPKKFKKIVSYLPTYPIFCRV